METRWNTLSEHSMRRQEQARDLDATQLLLLLSEEVRLVDETVLSLQVHLLHQPQV